MIHFHNWCVIVIVCAISSNLRHALIFLNSFNPVIHEGEPKHTTLHKGPLTKAVSGKKQSQYIYSYTALVSWQLHLALDGGYGG